MNNSANKKTICTHCQEEAIYSPLPDLEIHEVKVYFCHDCNAEYLYWSNESLASSSLYVKINGKMYRWTMSGRSGQLWYVKIPGVPGVRANEGMVSLIAFDWDICPVITPQNIEQKVRTILVLS